MIEESRQCYYVIAAQKHDTDLLMVLSTRSDKCQLLRVLVVLYS